MATVKLPVAVGVPTARGPTPVLFRVTTCAAEVVVATVLENVNEDADTLLRAATLVAYRGIEALAAFGPVHPALNEAL